MVKMGSQTSGEVNMLSVTASVIRAHVEEVGGKCALECHEKDIKGAIYGFESPSGIVIGNFAFPNRKAANAAKNSINRFSATEWELVNAIRPRRK